MPPSDPRRRLPQIDRLVAELEPRGLPRPVVVDAVRKVLDRARRGARRGPLPSLEELREACHAEIRRLEARRLRRVINATGVVLHTNLGRAPLAAAALDHVVEVARGYCNLELDLETGRRGDRFAHVEPLLALAAGAEASLVVNNNAAALLLVCAALGRGREVVVSRGELIEIGGEFRLPDVVVESGAVLREVGTTNRTHVRDYERAVGPHTAFLLKVHPSNYRVVGFATTPPATEVAGVARRHRLPFVYDVGSGLLGTSLADEPTADGALTEGANLVCFSGDKLFGGPQAGIIVGSAHLVRRLRSHPLLRALRPDKMQLAALEATVLAHLDRRTTSLPVASALRADPDVLARRAAAVARAVGGEVRAGESVAGGGSLPGHTIPTSLVRYRHPTLSPSEVARRLRNLDVPVIVRVERGAISVDLRTVDPQDDEHVVQALSSLQ